MTDENDDMEPIQDLFDFYNHWPTLRGKVEALAQSETIGSQERLILRSMIDLVDRVGPEDLVDESH